MTDKNNYDFTPHDGRSGDSWEEFNDRLMNYAAGEVDDRGWPLADCFLGADEGGATGPAMPGAGAATEL